jgi:hypothetical protein
MTLKLLQHILYTQTKVLRQDIRGTHQGRGKVMTTGISTNSTNSEPDSSSLSEQESKIVEYMCRLDSMLLKFITTASEIRVISIELYKAPLSVEG